MSKSNQDTRDIAELPSAEALLYHNFLPPQPIRTQFCAPGDSWLLLRRCIILFANRCVRPTSVRLGNGLVPCQSFSSQSVASRWLLTRVKRRRCPVGSRAGRLI